MLKLLSKFITTYDHFYSNFNKIKCEVIFVK